MKTKVFALIWLLSLGLASYAYAETEKPRIGLETETAFHNADGQLLIVPSNSEWQNKAQKILEFWKNVYGGEIREIDGKTQLDWGHGRPGTFRVDREWASDLGGGDGYEIVTPPLGFEEAQKYIRSYDTLKTELGLSGGIKTSQQFNIELRSLIPGFSLRERPTSKLGISYSEIQYANVSKVVDLFLFLERNVHFIYAAYAPKRLGNLVNYFAVPMSFEHEQLLKELEAMPPDQRTYERVRQVFMNHKAEESHATQYGGRTDWKYRTYNMRKFFAFNESNPTWVFPAIEIRLPDTPTSGAELKKQLDLTYALFEVGSQSGATASQDGSVANATYRSFLRMYREKLPFAKAIRVVNQDMVARSLTPEFKVGYASFLKKLALKAEAYPAFAGAEASPFISQTYDVYRLIRAKKSVVFLDRTIQAPDVEIPWDLGQFTYGAEFEFNETPGVLEKLKRIPFLESEVTIESTGNREVITKPTGDIHEYFRQLQYMRDFLGDDLKSIHVNFRFPKDFYERIPKQKFDSWIARVSDWISVLRANYRNPKYAFRTRTLNRMQVDTPNSWIGDDKAEYRGTMRIYLAGDKMNVEIRGLMDGIYTEAPLEPDLHAVALLIVLTGIQNPQLIEGNYAHRLVSEVRDPVHGFEEAMRKFANARGLNLEAQPHKVADLVKAMRAPNLMLFPLMGFEYLPLISGHDIKRMQNATLNWKADVWKVLANRDLDEEKAKEEFVKTLKDWSKASNLEHALLDSLLVRPGPGLSWGELNLPVERMRCGFLTKMLQMQSSEFAKAGIDLFLVTWLRKEPRSLVQAAKLLESEQLQKLVSVVEIHESSSRARTFLKEVGVMKAKAPNSRQKVIPIFTNLEALAQKDVPRLAAPYVSPMPEGPWTMMPSAPMRVVTEEQKLEHLRLHVYNSLTRSLHGESAISADKKAQDETLAAYRKFMSLDEAHREPEILKVLAPFQSFASTVEGVEEKARMAGDDNRIALALRLAPFLKEEKRIALTRGLRNSLLSFLIYETDFNNLIVGSTVRSTVLALKALGTTSTFSSDLRFLAEEYNRSRGSNDPMSTDWKNFVTLIGYGTQGMSSSVRLEFLMPAVPALFSFVNTNLKAWTPGEVTDHLKALAPYATRDLLETHPLLRQQFRSLKVPAGHSVAFPPLTSIASTTFVASVESAAREKRVALVSKFLASHPDLSFHEEKFSAEDALSADDPRIQALVKIRPLLPNDFIPEFGPYRALLAHLIFKTDFNHVGDKELTKRTLVALKDLNPKGFAYNLKWIALSYTMMRYVGTVAVDAKWYAMLDLIEYGLTFLDPDQRRKSTETLVDALICTYRAKKASLSTDEITNFLRSVAPYVSDSDLNAEPELHQAYRDLRISYGASAVRFPRPDFSTATAATHPAVVVAAPPVPDPSRLNDVVSAAPEGDRVGIIERFIAHHPELNRTWETLNASNALNGDDMRIRQLVLVRRFLPADKLGILNGAKQSLYAYLVHVSKVSDGGITARNTVKALKDLSGSDETYITALVKEFVRRNTVICCGQSYFKDFILMTDQWTYSLSPEHRLKILAPAVDLALSHVADKISNSYDVLSHLEAIAPYLSLELLQKHARVADAFRSRQMRFGPPNLTQVLPPPSPPPRTSRGDRTCSETIFSNMCSTCPNRHRSW